jgi:hypothetical protein
LRKSSEPTFRASFAKVARRGREENAAIIVELLWRACLSLSSGRCLAAATYSQPAVSLDRLHEYYSSASLGANRIRSATVKPAMAWHRSIVGFLVGLLLHASTLAAMPLVWCVGAHGHNAIELCAGHSCHHGALPAAMGARPLAKTAFMEVVGAHDEPCVDRSVMQEQLQAADLSPPVAAPVIVAVAPPLVIGQTSSVVGSHRVAGEYYLRPATDPPSLRSVVLRI